MVTKQHATTNNNNNIAFFPKQVGVGNMQLLAVTNYRKQALLVIPLHRILEKQRLHFKEDYNSTSNSNFLSMEYQVLDNLPHDLVYSPDQVSPWMEVWIEKINGRFVTFAFSEYW